MCLENRKKPDKEYDSCWKVFLKKEDGLHSPLVRTKDLYTRGVYISDYGFHGFIRKEDAEELLKCLNEIFTGTLASKKPKDSELIIKKVPISNVVSMGFSPRNTEECLGDAPDKSDNALQFKIMTVE